MLEQQCSWMAARMAATVRMVAVMGSVAAEVGRVGLGMLAEDGS